MPAKQSAEMREAIRLKKDGWNITQAAKVAGVHRVSLSRALKREREKLAERCTFESARRDGL